jgi:hypothetical protein
LRVQVQGLRLELDALRATKGPAAAVRNGNGRTEREIPLDQSFDNERLYQVIRARLVDEAPGILRVLTIKPELIVDVERKTLTVDGTTLKGRVAKLLASGFFRDKKRHTDVKNELQRTGPSVHGGNLSKEFDALVNLGFLTDEGDGYLAVPGAVARIEER